MSKPTQIFAFLRSLIPVAIKPPRAPLNQALAATGYYRIRTRLAARGQPVKDDHLYRPLYSPWEGEAEFQKYYDRIRDHTLVSPDRCWILLQLMRHALRLDGDFAEFGVFRGGTALLAANVLKNAGSPRTLHLFDSFIGMPDTARGEAFEKGHFSDTSESAVRRLIETTGCKTDFHVGYIPETFEGLQISSIAFAHVDVDLAQAVLDAVAFVYPQLVPGGLMVFDDYGFPSCSLAREATDTAFADRPEKPIYLPTGQAMVIKLP